MPDKNNNLLEHYKSRLMRPRGAALESGGLDAAVDFSDAAIRERVSGSEEELHRIIRDYLDDRSELHELAGRMLRSGDTALRRLRDNDEQSLQAGAELRAGLETIVHLDGSRPSFLVRDDTVDLKSSPPGSWSDTLAASADLLGNAIACVGRIDVPEFNPPYVGTGFLVGEDVILTNRHVLQLIARPGAGDWQIAPSATIDFGHEFRGRASVAPRALKSVLFCGSQFIDAGAIDHSKLDLALIRLEPATANNRPARALSVDIAPDWAQPGLTTFVVGYPAPPGYGAYTPTLLEQLFQSLFGYKRLAPGLIAKPSSPLSPWSFAHDATTLGGNSGSAVLVAGREKIAAGLHYGGRFTEPRENWGHVLGLTLDQRAAPTAGTLREIMREHGVDLIDGLGK